MEISIVNLSYSYVEEMQSEVLNLIEYWKEHIFDPKVYKITKIQFTNVIELESVE